MTPSRTSRHRPYWYRGTHRPGQAAATGRTETAHIVGGWTPPATPEPAGVRWPTIPAELRAPQIRRIHAADETAYLTLNDLRALDEDANETPETTR